MEKNIKEIYKKLSEQASKDGYYLIPKSFYERLSNTIEELRINLKTARESREKWKIRYYAKSKRK